MKSVRKKHIIIIIVGILVLGLIAIFITNALLKEESDKPKADKTTTTTKAIGEEVDTRYEPLDDYEPMRGDVVVDDKIDASASSDETMTNYELATSSEQIQFKISDVKLKKGKKATTITGEVKNILSDKDGFVLTIDFYEKDKIIGSSSIPISKLSKDTSQKFELSIMNDLVTDDYKVYIKYIKK